MLRKFVPLFMLLLFALPRAEAQEQQLTINLFVNYGAAYREGSWAPVDVLVDNKLKDVDGWVQVTAYDANNEVLSPIYRVAANSPRQSNKRFRLTCKLAGASRVEAQLFDNGRPVGGPPSYVNVTPIREQDFLCLVLDDKPDAYGFLSTALYGGKDIRFHRESLDTGRLAFLADNLACYTPFDLIVLGEIDPSRIGVEHRQVLTDYVRQGGTIVVWTGANSSRYRGSWLGDLMGVTLGDDALYNGAALAEAVFPPALRTGASAEQQTNATRLTPLNASVKLAGDPFAIAALNPVGEGQVATIAVDAISKILQNCTGFHEVLRDLAARGRENAELNYAMAGQTAVSQLPSVAGVELSPLSSVITYLLLYFFIAIVGNWLFWNWMKRREMAWVCLVFFSFGFTGYAMFFGTQGRARETELEQFTVYRVSPETGVARQTVFAGLLAKGSGRFSGTLTQPNALLADLGSDLSFLSRQVNTGFGDSGRRPFIFAKTDEAARIEDFRIGASEMRVIQIENHLELDGGMNGSLAWDETGVHGSLTNETGLALQDARLYLDGAFYPLQQRGGTLSVHLSPEQFQSSRNSPASGMNSIYYGYYGERRSLQQFKGDFHQALFATRFQTYDGQSYMNPLIGPCVVAWANDAPQTNLAMDTRATPNLQGVLLVADVSLTRTLPPPGTDISLPIQLSSSGGFHWLSSATPQSNWQQGRARLLPNSSADAAIQLPAWNSGAVPCEIVVAVLYPSDSERALAEHRVALFAPPGGPDERALRPVQSDTRHFGGKDFQRDTYRITNWRDALGRNQRLLSTEIRLIATTQDPNATSLSAPQNRRMSRDIEVTLTAHAECVAGATAEGANDLWR